MKAKTAGLLLLFAPLGGCEVGGDDQGGEGGAIPIIVELAGFKEMAIA